MADTSTTLRPKIVRPYRMIEVPPGLRYPNGVWWVGSQNAGEAGGTWTFIVTPTTVGEAQRVMWSLEALSLSTPTGSARIWDCSCTAGELDDQGASAGFRWPMDSQSAGVAGDQALATRHGGAGRNPNCLPDFPMNPRSGGGVSWTLTCITTNAAINFRLAAWGYTWDITGPNRGLMFARPPGS